MSIKSHLFVGTLLAGFLGLGLSAPAPAPAHAASKPDIPGITIPDLSETTTKSPNERRKALVIGNGAYANAPLQKPTRDAKSVAEALRLVGFEVELHQNLSGEQMERVVDKFAADLKASGALGLFYYSGHGVQNGEQGYLVPVDISPNADETDMRYKAMPLGRVLAKMEGAREGVDILLIDACRNNPWVRSFKGASGGEGALQMMAAGKRSLIGFATRQGSVATEGPSSEPHSVFTHNFLKTMFQPGKPLRSILDDVQEQVRAQTEQRQIPDYNSSLGTREVYLVPPRREDKAETAWATIKNSSRPEDMTAFAAAYSDSPLAAVALQRVQVTPKAGSAPQTPADTDCKTLAMPPYTLPGEAGVKLENVNVEAALPACRTMAMSEPLNPMAHALYGRVLHRAKRYDEARLQFQEAADLGEASSQMSLGVIYENGNGVPRDYEKAVAWYRKAADQGNIIAQSNLGYMYRQGWGVDQDFDKARALFTKAAEQGYPRAYTQLADMAILGLGEPHDDSKAVTLLLKAAEAGDLWGQNYLGAMYFKGRGVKKDATQAALWYRKAAERNYAPAQGNLGSAYNSGFGVPKDSNQAFFWWRKAAEQGDISSQNWLGVAYADGRGVDRDAVTAVYWYRKAAEQDDGYGQANLGFMYERGNGVSQDYAIAVKWYRKAAEQGNPQGQNNLGFMYEKGLSIPMDYTQAVTWYRKAAEQNYVLSQSNLGYMYEEGLGVSKDMAQALYWYRKAAEQGDLRAIENLKKLERN